MQKWLKTYFTYDVTHKKNKTQNEKKIFLCRLKLCSLCLMRNYGLVVFFSLSNENY